MKHFSEARTAVRNLLLDPGVIKKARRLVAIWDLRGLLRIMVEPADGEAATPLAQELSSSMTIAADAFWSKSIWVATEKSSHAEKLVFEEAWALGRELQSTAPSIREVERRLSKETWFGQPLKAPWPLVDQTPPIVSFFSIKGGVGRTTAAAAFSIQAARAKKKVCILDLDLEAPGIGLLFAPTSGAAKYGVVDYLLERPLHTGSAINLDEYIHQCDEQSIIGTDGTPITVVPAGTLDSDYLEKLARIDYAALAAGPPEKSPLSDLLKQLKSEFNPSYVIIDSRAGLHDIGGFALNGIAHLDILFGLDSEQSWEGLRIVVQHLGQSRIEQGLPQQDCALTYAMAPGSTTRERPNSERDFALRAHDLFSDYYYSDEPATEWPPPAVDSTDQPHYPSVIGYSSDIQRARSVSAAADLLTQGDYATFGTWLLGRLGRTDF